MEPQIKKICSTTSIYRCAGNVETSEFLFFVLSPWLALVWLPWQQFSFASYWACFQFPLPVSVFWTWLLDIEMKRIGCHVYLCVFHRFLYGQILLHKIQQEASTLPAYKGLSRTNLHGTLSHWRHHVRPEICNSLNIFSYSACLKALDVQSNSVNWDIYEVFHQQHLNFCEISCQTNEPFPSVVWTS